MKLNKKSRWRMRLNSVITEKSSSMKERKVERKESTESHCFYFICNDTAVPFFTNSTILFFRCFREYSRLRVEYSDEPITEKSVLRNPFLRTFLSPEKSKGVKLGSNTEGVKRKERKEFKKRIKLYLRSMSCSLMKSKNVDAFKKTRVLNDLLVHFSTWRRDPDYRSLFVASLQFLLIASLFARKYVLRLFKTDIVEMAEVFSRERLVSEDCFLYFSILYQLSADTDKMKNFLPFLKTLYPGGPQKRVLKNLVTMIRDFDKVEFVMELFRHFLDDKEFTPRRKKLAILCISRGDVLNLCINNFDKTLSFKTAFYSTLFRLLITDNVIRSVEKGTARKFFGLIFHVKNYHRVRPKGDVFEMNELYHLFGFAYLCEVNKEVFEFDAVKFLEEEWVGLWKVFQETFPSSMEKQSGRFDQENGKPIIRKMDCFSHDGAVWMNLLMPEFPDYFHGFSNFFKKTLFSRCFYLLEQVQNGKLHPADVARLGCYRMLSRLIKVYPALLTQDTPDPNFFRNLEKTMFQEIMHKADLKVLLDLYLCWFFIRRGNVVPWDEPIECPSCGVPGHLNAVIIRKIGNGTFSERMGISAPSCPECKVDFGGVVLSNMQELPSNVLQQHGLTVPTNRMPIPQPSKHQSERKAFLGSIEAILERGELDIVSYLCFQVKLAFMMTENLRGFSFKQFKKVHRKFFRIQSHPALCVCSVCNLVADEVKRCSKCRMYMYCSVCEKKAMELHKSCTKMRFL